MGVNNLSWKETYQSWIKRDDLEPSLKEELTELEGQESKLEEAFYAPMEFGTAGMRGSWDLELTA